MCRSKTFIICAWIARRRRSAVGMNKPLRKSSNSSTAYSIQPRSAGAQGHFLLRRYASFLTMTMVFLTPAMRLGALRAAASDDASRKPFESQPDQTPTGQSQPPPLALPGTISAYEGKLVQSVRLPGVPDADQERLLKLLPQKAGEPLDRDRVRDSIRALFATGRFADIQAEATSSGSSVVLTFSTSANFFIDALDVEGAPDRPNTNQIINASKFQLGELHTLDKLDRGLKNIRQLMQENGFYRARVTAESTSNPATQQVDVLFHVTAGDPAHVGEVKVTGNGGLSQGQVQDLARMHPGDRVTASRVNNSLQRLRKKFQKQRRVLAQVSIAQQQYHPESNAVDYTYLIDPGPIVVIDAEGFHISRRVLKRLIPVYEENALDDDLLNEGKRNLLDYLQTRGHFDAKVEIQQANDSRTLRVTYRIDPGRVHKLVRVDLTGNKNFLDTASLLSRMQIQPASRFLSHGRYSGALLKSDVATLEGLYRSNGFRKIHIQPSVEDNYEGSDNRLAVHLHIDEGPQTLVGEVKVNGNQQFQISDLPGGLETEAGQTYSEEKLTSDRERILNEYFKRGFPNANMDVSTDPSTTQPDREDVTYTIREGEQFFVNHVMVTGLDHTRDYVVRRELQVEPEKPLSLKAILDTQTKLYDLGIFSQVDTAVQNPEGYRSQEKCSGPCPRGQALHLHLWLRLRIPNRTARGRNRSPGQHRRQSTGRLRCDASESLWPQPDPHLPVPRRSPAAARPAQLRDS